MGTTLSPLGIIYPDATVQSTAKYGSYRNRIINGNMTIAQRGTSFVSPATNTYTLDRWVYANTTTAAVTITKQTEVPILSVGGESYTPATDEVDTSLKITVTTADASINTADYAHIAQRIEGINIGDLIDRPFTVSFNVRTSIAGNFCVSLRNETGTKSLILGYTQPAQTPNNTIWGRHSFVVVDGLPSDAAWNTDIGVGLRVEFTLCSGSTYMVGNAEQWYSLNALALPNQTNLFATVGNTFEVTGVQVEKNAVIEPKYDLRSESIELAMCQRYYCLTGASVRGKSTVANQLIKGTIFYPQIMRAPPTFTVTSVANSLVNTPQVLDITTYGATWHTTITSVTTSAYSVYATLTASTEI